MSSLNLKKCGAGSPPTHGVGGVHFNVRGSAHLRFFVLAFPTRTRTRHLMNCRFDHEELQVYPLTMPVAPLWKVPPPWMCSWPKADVLGRKFFQEKTASGASFRC